MIVVNFDDELREAFAAGEAAATARLVGAKTKHPLFEAVPKTYDEWIASISDRPAVVRG